MGDNNYEQRTVIVKHKKEEGKIKRWVVNPITRFASWKIDDPKKERVSA